jgi:hypothetical protein
LVSGRFDQVSSAPTRLALVIAALTVGCSPSGGHAPGALGETREAATLWIEQQKVVAATGQPGSEFGSGVALSGATAVIGAPGAGNATGSAHVFVRNGAEWEEGPALVAPNAGSFSIGRVMALAGDELLIGDPGAQIGDREQQGATYVFAKSGTSWTPRPTLVAAGGDWGDGFGSALAVEGDTLLVGTSGDTVNENAGQGSVRSFARSGTTWSEDLALEASDGAEDDHFGSAVALADEQALVGAPGDDIGATEGQGSVYVFTRDPAWRWSWNAVQKLTASDGATNDEFGSPIAVSGLTAIIGAGYASKGTSVYQGKAYVFVRNGSIWTEQQILDPTDGAARDFFGISVALSGGTAFVGAPSDNGTGVRGSVSIFARTNNVWTRAQKFSASDGELGDRFGVALAVSGTTLLVGAKNLRVFPNNNQGAAYFVELGKENGDPCTTSPECASRRCVDGHCCNAACDGECDRCSVAAGGATDGVCSPAVAGSPGSPTCAATLGCTGLSGDCSPCGGDSQCASTHYCNADGACTAQKDQGDACDLAADADCKLPGCRACPSGHCVDGVCCESACDATCEACVDTLTGSPSGRCDPIPGGEDPAGECEPSPGYPNDCGADGACSGERSCRAYATPTTACGETACSDGVVSGQLCDGSGQCREDTAPCAPYLCDGSACGTSCGSDVDCAPERAYCTPRATCAEKQPAGEPCTGPEQCESTFCTDGVCCESACGAQCEACAEPGSEGRCSAVTGAPRGERALCAGDPDVCGGECDGADVSECHYAPATRVCGGSCEDGREIPESCDGEGECVEGRERSCGDYACDTEACRASCDDDSHCAAGRSCTDGECVPSTAPSGSTDYGGCGCRTAGSRTRDLAGFASFLTLVLVAAGRRRKASARIAFR